MKTIYRLAMSLCLLAGFSLKATTPGLQCNYALSGSAPIQNSYIERNKEIHYDLYYDVSGSMDGKKSEVQANTMIAYVKKLFNDPNTTGVSIYPYDSDIHQLNAVQLTTKQQADRWLEQRQFLKPSGSSDANAPYHHFILSVKTDHLLERPGRMGKRVMVLFTDDLQPPLQYQEYRELAKDSPSSIEFISHTLSQDSKNQTIRATWRTDRIEK